MATLTAQAAPAPSPDAAPAPPPAVVTATNQPPPAIPTMVYERVSVFDPATPGARDPFYPRSASGFPALEKNPKAAQPPRNIFSQLRLRGLVANRLAMINGRTFGLNEEASVQLENGGSTRITVHEITDKTVTITLSGETEKRVLRSSGSQK